MVKLHIAGITALSLCISSCARVPQGSEEHVASIVQERIGKKVQWNNVCYEDPRITCRIQDLVSQPINIESAIQIALLNNPEVQATFEEVGIALQI